MSREVLARDNVKCPHWFVVFHSSSRSMSNASLFVSTAFIITNHSNIAVNSLGNKVGRIIELGSQSTSQAINSSGKHSRNRNYVSACSIAVPPRNLREIFQMTSPGFKSSNESIDGTSTEVTSKSTERKPSISLATPANTFASSSKTKIKIEPTNESFYGIKRKQVDEEIECITIYDSDDDSLKEEFSGENNGTEVNNCIGSNDQDMEDVSFDSDIEIIFDSRQSTAATCSSNDASVESNINEPLALKDGQPKSENNQQHDQQPHTTVFDSIGHEGGSPLLLSYAGSDKKSAQQSVSNAKSNEINNEYDRMDYYDWMAIIENGFSNDSLFETCKASDQEEKGDNIDMGRQRTDCIVQLKDIVN